MISNLKTLLALVAVYGVKGKEKMFVLFRIPQVL